jgi:hypothetical protein
MSNWAEHKSARTLVSMAPFKTMDCFGGSVDSPCSVIIATTRGVVLSLRDGRHFDSDHVKKAWFAYSAQAAWQALHHLQRLLPFNITQKVDLLIVERSLHKNKSSHKQMDQSLELPQGHFVGKQWLRFGPKNLGDSVNSPWSIASSLPSLLL